MTLPFGMSRMLRGVAIVAVVAPVLFETLPAYAAVLTAEDILTQFNAVVSNNFSTNSDVEGRLVAGIIHNTVTRASTTIPIRPVRRRRSRPSTPT